MQSGFTPLLKSSRNHLRVLAIGCVATGGVAAFLLPGVAQSPAIVPAESQDQGKKAPSLAPLPAMSRNEDAVPTSAIYSDLENGALNGNSAPAPKTRSLAQAQSQALKFNIEFRDIPVSELLAMVAIQGDSSISIGSDVDAELKISYIRLNDVTPGKAISKIADSAGLKWQETGTNEFFVGKVLPAGMSGKSANAVTPLHDSESEWADITAGVQSNTRAKKQAGTPFDSLVNINSNKNGQRAERTVRPIRIRNVRPGIIAWWIDAKNQEMPIEFKQAKENLARNLSPHMLKSGVDPAEYAQLNNRNSGALPFASPYVPGAYQNPYANPAAAGYMNALQPNYRVNNQFGGGNNNNNNNNNGGGGQGGFSFNTGVLQLPQDAQGNPLVDQLVAIDSQNVLLVYGTDEGITQLQNIIDYLDRPIRQVEIEAQFIDVSVNDSRAFGIQFSNRNSSGGTPTIDTDNDGVPDAVAPGGGGIGAGIPNANQLTISYRQYQAQLNFLSQKGNSRIINSPRVTTMNNLSASLQSQQITPILLTSTDTGIGGQVGQEQQAFFLTTSIGLQVTPTINNDDTITVFMTPFVQSQVPTPGLVTGGGAGTGSGTIPTVLAQSLTTVANVKDNDVIVLGGLRTRTESIVNSRIPILSRIPVIGKLFRTSNKTDIDRELVIFLTARIQRRTEDVTPIQGP